MENINIFASNLKKIRKQRKMTQQELATRIGTDQTTISKWENSNIEPSLDMLINTSEVLNVGIDYLLGAENNEPNFNYNNNEINELINLLQGLSKEELAAYLALLKARSK